MANIKILYPNTRRIMTLDETLAADKLFTRWVRCPSYCACVEVCNCDAYAKMSAEQLHELTLYLRTLYTAAKKAKADNDGN